MDKFIKKYLRFVEQNVKNTQACKIRKWTDNKFTEGADWNCKKYLISYRNFSTRNVKIYFKKIICMPLQFSETC